MTIKKIFLLTSVVLMGATAIIVSCSRSEGIAPDQEVIGTKTVCPVTGETFTVTKNTPVIEYNNEKYYFCCPGCDKDFAENPGKYINKLRAHVVQPAEADELDFGKQAVCPVRQETFTITEHTPTVMYDGELYYFCCPGCDTEFMEDPQKFLRNEKGDVHSDTTGTSGEEIAYWTCSMHPEVKSDTEGNCPICGMALIPKLKQSGSSNFLFLDDAKIELAGIRVLPARSHTVHKEIEIAGSVAYDPELVIAQEEYLTARAMRSALDGADDVTRERTQQVIDKARYKLRLLGMDDTEIQRLANTGTVTSSLVMPDGEAWVYADAYEADIPWILRKQHVRVTAQAFPGEEFGGIIASINPTLNTMTRAVRVRIRLYEGSGKLMPGMYVSVKIQAAYTSPQNKNRSTVIAVPRSAVIDTGNRSVVWVYKGEGNFEPRLVQTGPAGIVRDGETETGVYPILSGLDENELVVVNGNFLIDSESQITGIAAIGYSGALEVDE
jgi:YHS domain-containing protein